MASSQFAIRGKPEHAYTFSLTDAKDFPQIGIGCLGTYNHLDKRKKFRKRFIERMRDTAENNSQPSAIRAISPGSRERFPGTETQRKIKRRSPCIGNGQANKRICSPVVKEPCLLKENQRFGKSSASFILAGYFMRQTGF